ncbi:MAG TPA: hypothetical protein VEH31_30470 [Streptosporangiaceae bacterium]|nr:hypothetical protein [Streptosporangiaceae bacterium]
MGRPGSALDNAVIGAWHSTLEFDLQRIEHFTTKTAARAKVAAWIEGYKPDVCRRWLPARPSPHLWYPAVVPLRTIRPRGALGSPPAWAQHMRR